MSTLPLTSIYTIPSLVQIFRNNYPGCVCVVHVCVFVYIYIIFFNGDKFMIDLYYVWRPCAPSGEYI